MNISRTAQAHLSEEVAEAFSRGKLSEEQLAPVEEHLLLCDVCRHSVEEWDEFIQVARVALKERQEIPRQSIRWSHGRGWMAAIAIAAMCVIAFVIPKRTLPETAVTLQSMRDSESSVVPFGHALTLRADAQGLQPAGTYRLQVVRASGQLEHDLPAIAEGGHASAKLKSGLAAGRYWIRLCNESGAILREFELNVQ